MTNKELLEKIAEAINDSTESIKIMVPSNDYYARKNECVEDVIEVINPESLIRSLQQLADSL